MFDKNILACNIKNYRKLKNLSQNELAKALYISPQAVSKWESAVTTPDIENLCAIASILEVTVDSLLNDSSAERAMVCIDSGGSKTEFLLFTAEGKIIKRLVLDGANPNIIGTDASYSIFKRGIDIVTNKSYQLTGIYIGGAGMGSGNNAEIILKKLKKDYPNIPKDVKTDICSVIAGSTNEEKCTALICGTGAVVYANTPTGLKRFGGWGAKLDTLGSGYDIGREALRTALGEREGIIEPSLITPLVEQKIKTPVWDSIHHIYEKGDSYIASFAPTVFEAYYMGDKTAEKILNDNAKRLAELILKANRSCDCGNTIVASGSVITKNKVYAQMIKNSLPAAKEFIVSENEQIYGAAKMCLKLCKADDKAFCQNFLEQYTKILSEE